MLNQMQLSEKINCKRRLEENGKTCTVWRKALGKESQRAEAEGRLIFIQDLISAGRELSLSYSISFSGFQHGVTVNRLSHERLVG